MEPIVVVPYQDQWREEFNKTGMRLKQFLGSQALRIDHIGSTAVPGLDAKPIIDIQISVASLEPVDSYKSLLEKAGFVHRTKNPDLTKRYFREEPGDKRTHIHVRERGSWSEQFPLLFRDYLRKHPEDCHQYAQAKYKLVELYHQERGRYVEEKEPIIWEIMRRASQWSQKTGWRTGKSDL